jgi:repressor LexA
MRVPTESGFVMTYGLTRRQGDLLAFIRQQFAATGQAPSYDEMKLGLGMKSKAGIHSMLTRLEERGYIRRLPFRARSIQLVEGM